MFTATGNDAIWQGYRLTFTARAVVLPPNPIGPTFVLLIKSYNSCSSLLASGSSDSSSIGLNKDFFARAVRNNECFSKSTYYNYDTLFYYYCNPNINISNLDDIVFKRKDWGNDIIFTPQELFKTIDNYKYFLIFFINNDRSFYRWKLGRLFLQKVKTIILDKERKIIGRYTMETNPEIKENELKNELKTKRRIWIIVIVLIVISIILAFYLNKLFTKMRRKKRLNEVIDDYDYTPVNA